ncbi:SNF2 family DNA or RNA helicase [Evansella vedderi]|uniref:SNF2 family DNA or RNA helicase n=1 Tax=Evansella vedderi TaxID=38282 RepID=A0ABT9ZY13_9BACI|nr:DEAD/DEAH box helicase [Evansella vedderi]MDQ0255581.1 SNF2 family DNA or RNA helicase [Evansella vedderi]
MKLNYTNQGLEFRSDSFDEALLKSECFKTEKIHTENLLSWHYLVTASSDNVTDTKSYKQLRLWGLAPNDGVEVTQNVLNSKRKGYKWDMTPIHYLDGTPQYERALELVKGKFGGPLRDGSTLFPYQIETAAAMIAKGRLLNAFDMGLGKTRTSLAGALADPSNKRFLIITMSRNINDWVREIETLGHEDDYIILQHAGDLKSQKRIHLVSYEKWSADRVKFAKKPQEECPDCGMSHKRAWKSTLGYCYVCKTSHEPYRVNDDGIYIRWSEDDLPEQCPSCKKDWKGRYQCTHCDYTVIESRKKALHTYYHNGYNACIVDEAQYIKNGKSKRALAVQRVKTNKRFALSGTPAENGADDLFWLLGWLTGFTSRFEDPITNKPYKGYGKTGEENFREYFAGGKKRRVLDIDSVEARASHHEQLWGILDTLMVRKKKQDDGVKEHTKVPKPEHHRMHLNLHEAERELYDKFVEEFKEWYELELAKKEAAEARDETYRISTIEICAWMDKLRKAASSPWQYEEYDAKKSKGTTSKLEYTKNKARDLLRRNKKMLIFSGHKNTVEQLGLLLDGVLPGKEAGYIHGGVKMEYRWELMKRFQDPSDPLSILVMSHKTGAESYTLTEAKAVFLYDLDFNPKKIEQCYSRAVRLGQLDKVDVYWLLGVDTIDVNMHGLVLSKASGVDIAIDRKELDFNELAKEFKGDGVGSGPTAIDYEEFASEMLSRGTKREEIA